MFTIFKTRFNKVLALMLTLAVSVTFADFSTLRGAADGDGGGYIGENRPQTTNITNAQTPVITVQPRGEKTSENALVTLSVVATISDGGKLTYQWYKEGVKVTGATSAQYSPNTSVGGSAQYRVAVTNTNYNVNGTKTATELSDYATVFVASKTPPVTPPTLSPNVPVKTPFNFTTDVFNFNNSDDSFYVDNDGIKAKAKDKEGNIIKNPDGTDKLVDDYDIKTDWLKHLTDGEPDNTRQQTIENEKVRAWGGSCVGMSYVAALVKAGQISPAVFQSGITNTSGFAVPNKSFVVESLINYYHLSQSSTNISEEREKTKTGTPETNKLVFDTVKSSEYPVSVGFDIFENATSTKRTGGHEVLAVEANDDNKGYHVLTIYDNRYKGKRKISISPDYATAEFIAENGIEKQDNPVIKLQHAFTVDVINKRPIQSAVQSGIVKLASVSDKTYTNYLETNYQNFSIYKGNANNSNLSSAKVVNGEVTAYSKDGSLKDIWGWATNEVGYSLGMKYILPELKTGEYYQIVPNSTEKDVVDGQPLQEFYTGLLVNSENGGYLLMVDSQKEAGNIALFENGRVYTSYNSGVEQTISVTRDDANTDWYTATFNGVSNSVDVTQTRNNVTLNSASASTFSVSVNDSDNAAEFTPVLEKKVIVGEDSATGKATLSNGAWIVETKTFNEQAQYDVANTLSGKYVDNSTDNSGMKYTLTFDGGKFELRYDTNDHYDFEGSSFRLDGANIYIKGTHLTYDPEDWDSKEALLGTYDKETDTITLDATASSYMHGAKTFRKESTQDNSPATVPVDSGNELPAIPSLPNT